MNTKQNALLFKHYDGVLKNSTQLATTNKGIRVWNKRLTTYSQTKVGLSSIYIKRQVQSDGVSTAPLNI